MSERPWMKFYPKDWRADAGLRSCSLAARGLWIDLLSLMHEATPYGHLLIGTSAGDRRNIGAVLGIDPRTIGALLRELEVAGVFSRTEAGVIYSRRMVRDEQRAENAQKNGSLGGNPQLRKTPPSPPSEDPSGVNPAVNGELKAQIPEARSQIKEKRARAMGKHPSRARAHGSDRNSDRSEPPIRNAFVRLALAEVDRQRQREAEIEEPPGDDGFADYLTGLRGRFLQ